MTTLKLLASRRTRHGRTFPAVLLLTLVFLVAGCGIPTFTYLAPPESSRIDVEKGISQVTFQHNAADNNPDIFRGYEIYYKLYDDPNDQSAFDADRNAITAEPEITGLTRLNANGFHRIVKSDRTAPTLLMHPDIRDDAFTIELNFDESVSRENSNVGSNASANWRVDSEGIDEEVALLRSALDTSNRPKSFFPLDDTAYDYDVDPDLVSLSDPQYTITNSRLAIGLFVLAYGLDEDFSPAYSIPVTLGYFEVQE